MSIKGKRVRRNRNGRLCKVDQGRSRSVGQEIARALIDKEAGKILQGIEGK